MDKPNKRHLTYDEYKLLFKGKEKKALERAWKNRDFEIELYWKRATYFWTFIAATFAGYVALISSQGFQENIKNKFPEIEYLIICLGFIFSLAWLLVNLGSKKWQRNWEAHIDSLETTITGPIYQTVYNKNSFSVSRINILVNSFVIAIWVLLGIKYLFENFYIFNCYNNIDWYILLATILTIAISVLMLFGKTNYRFGKQGYSFFIRESLYNNKIANSQKINKY